MLIEWLLRAKEHNWRGETIDDPTTLAHLEALGYTGDTESEARRGTLYNPECACKWCKRFQ